MTALVWRGKCLRMRQGKGSFRGVACSPEAKPAPSGAAGNTVDQNRLKPYRQRLFGLQGDLKSERQNGNPNSQSFFTVILIQPYLPANRRGDAHESSRDHDQRS
jgi:hypothetical protein